MAPEESGEQLSLQENQFLCTQLDYPGIASHLIQAGIITQEQNVQIEEAFVDNAGRMQKLISILIKLNSETSFDAFRDAVKQLGEMALAQKLLRDQSSFGDHLNAGDAHPCLYMPDALSQILSYLTQNDLSTARLVCKTWNAVIAACHIKKFTARFRNDSGHKQMIEFVSTGPKSIFCKHLNRFFLDIAVMQPSEWVFYKTFFLLFGPKLQYLQLGRSLNKDLLEFIFSSEIKQCLTNLKHLELFVFPDEGLIQTDSLSFLSSLETLALTENSTNSVANGWYFLEKFSEVEQRLKVLRLHFHSTVDTSMYGFPKANAILPKLSTLKDLVLKGVIYLNDNGLRLLTIPNGKSRLTVINFILGNVRLEILRDFITSHRHTLRWMKVRSCVDPLALMDVFPCLENLKYLSLYARICGWRLGGSISNLGFCTQAPNLKCLKIHGVDSQMISQPIPKPTFVHDGLKEFLLSFYYNSTADAIRRILHQVPQYFPNLIKLEVRARNVVWPVQLEHLQLQPGSCDEALWMSTKT